MKSSILVKLVLSGFIALLLLVPMAMVQSVVDERQRRRNEAIAEVTEKWGSSQTFVGPILSIPYVVSWKDQAGETHSRVERVQVLPDRLKIEGTVSPQIRRRGIFEVVLYGLDLKVTGLMASPDLAALGVAPDVVLWKDATLSIGITDTRGAKEQLKLGWDGGEIPFRPSAGGDPVLSSGIHALLPGFPDGGKSHPFAFQVKLQGSQLLSFAPLATETEVALVSTWPHPSFTGAFLPESRSVTPTGFTASWRVSHFGRNYPQQWKTEGTDLNVLKASLASSVFGVNFYRPADFYQQATRSIKYAILFIILTFTAFFLFEVFAGLRLHPLQYMLVGFALSLFYLLLVSVSEHAGFTSAYLVAAVATIGLITGYCVAILGQARRAVVIGGLLATLYAYLFVLLRVEDYALLMGSVALFVVLAVVMYVTRRIDWYAVGSVRPSTNAT